MEKYIGQFSDSAIKLEDIHLLEGANYFSAGPVLRFRVNLDRFDEVFTNEIQGFFEKLKNLLPGLFDHFCSVGEPGGFFLRVKEGTLLGHVMEHIAIELQTLAGMESGFGKTRMTKQQGVYNVVFRFEDKDAGVFAGIAALEIINSFIEGIKFDLKSCINRLIEIREKNLPGTSTQAIIDEAERRGIPTFRLDDYNMIQFGTGKYRKLIRATTTQNTSLIATEIADFKYRTTQILGELGIPTPKRVLTDNLEEALNFLRKNKKVVVKPASGYRGKNISIGITSEEQLKEAFTYAQEFDIDVIVQEHIEGKSFRLMVIDNKFQAVAMLEPPFIVGDGYSNIGVLIKKENKNPLREIGDKGVLSKIELDEQTLHILKQNKYSIDSILQAGKKLYLKNSGNLRLGGSSQETGNSLHPEFISITERISKIIPLDVVGIDIISSDISKPFEAGNSKVIEINSAPDFRPHLKPVTGNIKNLAIPFIKMLFPENEEFKIPILSVTGSKHTAEICDILLKFLSNKFKTIGSVISKEAKIGDYNISSFQSSYQKSYKAILKDPTVEFALFDIPVELILSHGLPYKFADYGVFLNISSDDKYFEYDHIRDMEDLAYAKSVVAEEVTEEGFSILNADDPLIMDSFNRLYSNAVLFSNNPKNEYLLQQIEKNQTVVLLDNSRVVIYSNSNRYDLFNIADVSKFTFNPEDYDVLLAAVSVIYSMEIKIEEIRTFFLDQK